MASEVPTPDEVKEIRQDIEEYIIETKTLEDNYIPEALKRVKRFLEDKRGILWVQVWDASGSDYYVGADDVERNRDKIIAAIAHMAVSLVFKDHAIDNRDGQWWDLYVAYRADSEDSLRDAKLDIDLNEDGSIGDSETAVRNQPFVKR